MAHTNEGVRVGDTVVVTRPYRDDGMEVVTKVGRTWITVGEDRHAERFRADDRRGETRNGTGSRFYTLDQWAEKQQHDTAAAYLREQGITIDHGSPWRGREAELAAAIQTTTP